MNNYTPTSLSQVYYEALKTTRRPQSRQVLGPAPATAVIPPEEPAMSLEERDAQVAALARALQEQEAAQPLPQPAVSPVATETVVPPSVPVTSAVPAQQPGFWGKLGRGLLGAAQEGLKGVELGPGGYRQYRLAQALLPVQAAEREKAFERQKKLIEHAAKIGREYAIPKTPSPSEQAAQRRLEREIQYETAPQTLTKEQRQLLGVAEKKPPSLEEKLKHRAMIIGGLTNTISYPTLNDSLNQFDADIEAYFNMGFTDREIISMRRELENRYGK